MSGYDLSHLIKPAEAPAPAAAVSDLVMVGTSENIRDVIKLSSQLPILLELHATGASELGAKLERAVRAAAGKLVLVRIDAQVHADLAQAFGVERVPAVLTLVQGQPVPLFEGDIDEAMVAKYVARVLEVAAKNGLSGTVAVGEIPALSPLEEQALALLDAGDFDGAAKVYQDALAQNPRDVIAIAGLARVQLTARVETLDFERVLADSSAPLFDRADALAAAGEYEAAFALLLEDFASTKSADTKARLLSLFDAIGSGVPEVIAARKALTNLLY